MRQYFYINSDVSGMYWLLSEPRDEDGEDWMLLRVMRQPVASGKTVRLGLCRAGKETDLFVTPLGTLVAAPAMADLLRSRCGGEVQLLPCEVVGTDMQLCVANILTEYDCLDMTRSYIFGQDSVVPSLKLVARAVLDPSRIGPARIFHVRGISRCIVHKELKQLIEQVGARGVEFSEVLLSSNGSGVAAGDR